MSRRSDAFASQIQLGPLGPTIFAGALTDAEWEALVRRRTHEQRQRASGRQRPRGAELAGADASGSMRPVG